MDGQESREAQPETFAEESEPSAEARESFLSHISHELKSPLTTILAGSRVLLRYDDLDQEERQEILNDIAVSAEQLAGIVDNMLALSRLERGAGLQKEWVQLAPLVEESIQEFEPLHSDREVVARLDRQPKTYHVNSVLLSQVIKNLLDNAVKYSPPTEPIEVSFTQGEAHACFLVLDRGPGIPEDEEPRLFEPFYRSQAVSNVEGTGVGLSVCRQIIEVHGGEIWLKNREGGGTEAGFTLPARS